MKIKTESRIINNRIENQFGTGDFGQFRNYLALIESYLSQEKEKLEDSFDANELEEHSKIAGEHHSEYLNFLIGEHYKQKSILSFDFPNSFRTAFIIQLFSFLEFELRNICDYHAKLKDSNFSINDLKGNSDIDKARLYLKKGAKINFNNLNPEWEFINNVRVIRNLLVHHQGIIMDDHQHFEKVNNIVSKSNLLLTKRKNVDNNAIYHLVIPDNKMPENLISNIENLFHKLVFDELKI